MEEGSAEQLQQTMTTQCHYRSTNQTNIKTYNILLAHSTLGEPTGQMVNYGGWEKDEHGKFAEKECPEINCELTIGAWENKELNIQVLEEEGNKSTQKMV